MDKDEEVNVVIHFPEDFPHPYVQITRDYGSSTSRKISELSLEIRPSSLWDTSQGEIDIEKI